VRLDDTVLSSCRPKTWNLAFNIGCATKSAQMPCLSLSSIFESWLDHSSTVTMTRYCSSAGNMSATTGKVFTCNTPKHYLRSRNVVQPLQILHRLASLNWQFDVTQNNAGHLACKWAMPFAAVYRSLLDPSISTLEGSRILIYISNITLPIKLSHPYRTITYTPLFRLSNTNTPSFYPPR
jgi:hypothetical protein